MTLYQIVGDIKALAALADSLTDEETGITRELTEDEKLSFASWIAEESSMFDEKFDNVCKVYKNMRATADVCTAERDSMKAELDRLSKRAKAREAEADRVKGLIWFALDALGKQKHKTALFSAGVQKTGASIRIGDSVNTEENIVKILPDEFVTREVSKSAIVEKIKSGELYVKPVSTSGGDILSGEFVSPLDEGAVFGKTPEGLEYRLEGIKYLSGKTCIIR